MRIRGALGGILAALLTGCPAYEGPIDVILVDMDDTAEVTWSLAGADDFQPCENGVTNIDAYAGCGEYGVGEPGTYTIRVVWQDIQVDKDVTIEDDNDYQANVEVTFSADEFIIDED